MKKKVLLIAIMVILILSTNIAITLATSKTELENQKKDLNNKIENTKDQISEVKGEISETMKQIETLTNQIGQYEYEIEELDGELSKLENSISETQTKLVEAEKKYTEQEEALQARIVAQYEAGETTYLDVILGGGSLWDMISNWQMVSEIAEMDNQLLEQIEANKIEIEQAKKELETSKEQVETVKNNKEKTAKTLKDSQTQKEKIASKLSDEEKNLQDDLEKMVADQKEISRQLELAEKKYSSQIDSLKPVAPGNGILQRPVSGGQITATMYYSSGAYHGALDYGVSSGTTVYAAADGVVLFVGWGGANSYGNYICLQHSNGLRTYYAHGNGTFYVSGGQTVSRGQPIMLSGNTGKSFGPHLHFEVRVSPYNWSNNRVDPRNYL